jgi:hypothetical protein
MAADALCPGGGSGGEEQQDSFKKRSRIKKITEKVRKETRPTRLSRFEKDQTMMLAQGTNKGSASPIF